MEKKDFKNTEFSPPFEKKEPYSHEYFISGVAPYTRGIYASGYVKNPLEIITEKIPNLHYIHPQKTDNLETLLFDSIQKIHLHIEQGLQQQKKIDKLLSQIIVELPILNQPFDNIVFTKSIRTIFTKMTQSLYQKEIALKTVLTVTNDSLNQAIMAIFCGAEYLCIPKNSDFSKEEWLYFIKEECQLLTTIDPWGGNPYIEKKVDFLLNKCKEINTFVNTKYQKL